MDFVNAERGGLTEHFWIGGIPDSNGTCVGIWTGHGPCIGSDAGGDPRDNGFDIRAVTIVPVAVTGNTDIYGIDIV